MSFFNPYAIGFVCVAAGSVVGVDYVMQAKAAGSHPGAYAFSTYLDGYGLRMDDTMAFIDKTRRQSVDARDHLPAEPEGWQRVEWDIGAIDMDELTRGMDIVDGMAAKGERRKAIALANYEAWEYRKGDQIVRISASFDEDLAASETAVAGQLTGTFFPVKHPKYNLGMMVGNVPFLAVTDAKRPKQVTQTLLEARLNDEILIAVASDADPKDVLPLLEQIDFTSLNMMLSDPLPHLAEDAAQLSSDKLMILAGFQARALNSGVDLPAQVVAAIISGEGLDQLGQDVLTGLGRQSTDEATEEKPKVKRIQLSGGRVCKSNSARLCD